MSNLEIVKSKGVTYFKYFIIAVITVFSAVCSFELTTSSLNNIAIAVMLTIIIEGSLSIASYLFHKKNKGYFFLWVAYAIVSIIGARGAITSSIDVNVSSKIHNSAEYVQYLADKSSIDNQLNTFQNRLNNLNGIVNAQDSSTLNELNRKIEQKRAEMSRTPKTTKTQRLRDDIQKEIDSLNKSKSEIINIANNNNKNETDKQNEIKSIYEDMKKLNEKKEQIKLSMEKDLEKNGSASNAYRNAFKGMPIGEIAAWTLIFILVEITRFSFLNSELKFDNLLPTGGGPGKKSIKDKLNNWLNSNSQNKAAPSYSSHATASIAKVPKKFKVKKVKRKQAPVITLVPKVVSPTPTLNLDIDNKTVKAYIDLMYINATEKDGILYSDGYKTMGKNLRAAGYDIKDTTARKISEFLEISNVIEKQVGQLKRVIKIDKSSTLKLLKSKAS
jgi:hypothetical protein